jgi:hypothetical protein
MFSKWEWRASVSIEKTSLVILTYCFSSFVDLEWSKGSMEEEELVKGDKAVLGFSKKERTFSEVKEF